MTEIEEAKTAIERIRQSWIGDPSRLSSTDSMIKLLSTQLYGKATHFLLELLQNADDNCYCCLTPTVKITYQPGRLRFDCNELGFSIHNVEAICDMAKSTKKGSNMSAEYTGEKGIGFKAVFKVAQVVHVYSRPYSFKFDIAQPAGKVAPIWETFPEPVELGYTSFLLQLSEAYNANELVNELLNFETTNVLFLRRIRQIDLKILRSNEGLCVRSISRKDSDQGDERTIYVDGRSRRYITWTHAVDDLPKEEERPDCKKTHVILAFPVVDEITEPKLETQSVYAFLPIRNYGFKFLLQADFLVTASREDIDSSSPWNQALLQASVDAYMLAIGHLSLGTMKYQWPCFIPSNAEYTAFESFATEVLIRLKESKVLECCAGSSAKPSDLMYIPPVFRDGITPLTLCPRTASGYLSTNYPEWQIHSLHPLGVHEFSGGRFLDDLQMIVMDDPQTFQQKPDCWHEQLAEALLFLLNLTSHPGHYNSIKTLRIIPCISGKWISPSEGDVYFGGEMDTSKVLNGLNIHVVHHDVEQNQTRQRLLSRLGVKVLEDHTVSSKICELHGDPSFDPLILPRSELISHAKFLYTTSWASLETVDLWFSTAGDERRRGSELYIPKQLEEGSPACRVLTKMRDRLSTLHWDYFDGHPERSEWETWLQEKMHLALFPRVVKKLVKTTENLSLTYRLDWLFPSLELLEKDFLDDFKEQLANAYKYPMHYSLAAEPSVRQKGTNLKLELNNGSSWYPDMSTRIKSVSMPPDHTKAARRTISIFGGNQGLLTNTSKPAARPTKEFEDMFRLCESSDVLYILMENWADYGQWIVDRPFSDDAETLESKRLLRLALGAVQVQCRQGRRRLQETVLPGVDPWIEDNPFVPVLDIESAGINCEMLRYLGVQVKADIHYYLWCLQSTRAAKEDVAANSTDISKLYERIQAHFDGNEKLVGETFRQNQVIYVQAKGSGKYRQARWINLHECVHDQIDIESQYSRSEKLFRCLLNPTEDMLQSLVEAATKVCQSMEVNQISRLYQNISKALRGVSDSKANAVIKPLRDKKIFPIITKRSQTSYDCLRSIKDGDWYIADRSHLRESFHGKVSLLAFPAEEINLMEELFKALRIESLKLFMLVDSKTRPRGYITPQEAYARRIRSKSRFIKALVPTDAKDTEEKVERLAVLEVSSATEIVQTNSLRLGTSDRPIDGHLGKAQIASSLNDDELHIFLTEDSLRAKHPPFELGDLLANHFSIRNATHVSLLHSALAERNHTRIRETFSHQGIDVGELDSGDDSENSDTDDFSNRYRVSTGDLFQAPSSFTFDYEDDEDDEEESGSAIGYVTKLTWKNSGRRRKQARSDKDRLPFVNVKELGAIISLKALERIQTLDVELNLQYLGERMVLQFLQKNLDQDCEISDCWTSLLRHRAGYDVFRSPEDTASFTISALNATELITKWLVQLGWYHASLWRGKFLIYHIEVAVTPGDYESYFEWNAVKLDRVRHHNIVIDSSKASLTQALTVSQMRKFTSTDIRCKQAEDITILIRICDIYSEPRIDVFPDPWNAVLSRHATFRGKDSLQMMIKKEAGYLISRQNTTWLPSWNPGHEYKYTSISKGDIRLVHIIPGKATDPLKAVIFRVSLDENPSYRALSYTWGTNKHGRSLNTPEGRVNITSSLDCALRKLRHSQEIITLWVDSICIDQKEDTEKVQQIRLLPSIFQKAASTIVFLGDDSESDGALEALMQIRAAKLFGVDAKSWPGSLRHMPKSWGSRCIPPSNDMLWNSIGQLFERPWFRRTWTIQEVVLAPSVRVVCGDYVIYWRDLVTAVHIAQDALRKSGAEFSELESKWKPFLQIANFREWEARTTRWGFLGLADAFRYAQSTYKRDRLFALLSFAADGDNEDLNPDYKSPLQTVVYNYASSFVRQGRGMQLLYRGGMGSNPGRFPSWIPDWTIEKKSHLNESEHDASAGTSRPVIRCVPDSTVLSISGWQVDEVTSISRSSNTPAEHRLYFHEVDSMIDSLDPEEYTEDLADLKWKVPIADAHFPVGSASGLVGLHESYLKYRKMLSKEKFKVKKDSSRKRKGSPRTQFSPLVHERKTTDQDVPLAEKARDYRTLLDTLDGWRLIMTRRGFVGIAPNGARVGDLVSIFRGGDVPFIIRRGSELQKEHMYRLVGECYIHCMMQGESLDLADIVQSEILLY